MMHSDHRTGRQFSLRCLLVAMTLVACGLGMAVLAFRWTLYRDIPGWDMDMNRNAVMWLAGGGFIGGGLLLPFNRPVLGAIIGLVFQFVLGLLFLARVAFTAPGGAL
jgi:hypothetical protein